MTGARFYAGMDDMVGDLDDVVSGSRTPGFDIFRVAVYADAHIRLTLYLHLQSSLNNLTAST